MDLGFFSINMGALNHGEAIAKVVVAAERLGFESIWTAEHLVVIDPQRPPSPVPPHASFVDSVTTLAFAAALTKTIKLGSGIILLAQRNPVVLAKELSGIDVLSHGRLLFGVGVGYVPGEFEAVGIPYHERGARVSEHIEAIRTLWTQEQPAFQGRFSHFAGIQSRPRPIQKPHPPIITGGMSPPALRRAVAQANGWYGFSQDLDQTATLIDGLKETAKSTERPASLGRLTISLTPPGPVDADTAKRYEDLGVDRLIVTTGRHDMADPKAENDAETLVKFLEGQAKVCGVS